MCDAAKAQNLHRHIRYMPGYELFLDGLSGAEAPWRGRGYRLVLDADRAILREEEF